MSLLNTLVAAISSANHDKTALGRFFV